MTNDRPALIRTDVVTRAIMTLTGVSIAQVADALVPDMVTPGWKETGYTGTMTGVPAMDLVPTPGTPSIGNVNRRMPDGIHIFSSDWKDDATIMQGPAVIVEGGTLPDTVTTALVGMRLGDVVDAPSITPELADALIEWIEHPDPTSAKGQTMVGVAPMWLEQPTTRIET